MANRLQLRQGTTTEHNTFTGAVGEVTVDTDKDVLVVHDGVTAGGFPVASRANANGTISLIKKDGTIISSISATGLFNNTLTSTATDQALTAAQGKVLQDTKQESSTAFGVGQTYTDVTASRSINTVFTNSSPKPIFLAISVGISARTYAYIYCGANEVTHEYSYIASGTSSATLYAVVNPSEEYRLTGATSIVKWRERS